MTQEPRQALLLHPDDDVAVALRDLAPGTRVSLRPGGDEVVIVLRDPIPLGHKFALRAVSQGAHVRKFGQVIGAATSAIEPGVHVHVHNIASLRARVRT
jgi:altronate dehydratase